MIAARPIRIAVMLTCLPAMGGCAYYRTGHASFVAGQTETTVSLTDHTRDEKYAVSIALHHNPNPQNASFGGTGCVFTSVEERHTDKFVVAFRDCVAGSKIAPSGSIDFDWVAINRN